jgi:DNA polymerase III delta prime subunit
MSRNEFLWVESYRPSTIKECILPEDIKKSFQAFVDSGEIPNMLFSGPPGIGKTTVAKALCKELGVDSYVINGSDEGRFLDTVRNKAKNFASTVSLETSGKPKVIIIDEADNTTADVQLLLRANIETFHRNCRFIFTCNYKNKIIEPLHSRCAVFDFSITGKTKPLIAAQFFDRVREILAKESVTYDEKVVAEVISTFFPDWRRILNELQRYSAGGNIDSGILASFSDANIKSLMDYMKDKDFSSVRKWVVENLDNDVNRLIRMVYDKLYITLKPQFIPQAVIILANYQSKIPFVADQEINLLACFTEIMHDCQFK